MIRAVDLSGLVCPKLTARIWQLVQKMDGGDRLLVTLTYGLASIDVGLLLRDIADIAIHEKDGVYLFDIRKRS